MGILGRILTRHEAAPAVRRRRTRALYAPFQKSLPHGDTITLPGAVSIRPSWTRLSGLLVAAASLAGLAYLMGAERFRAADGQVTGAEFVDPATVLEATGALGQNVFLLDPAGIASSLSRLPDLASAEVRLILPNRVSIHTREKEAWGALQIGEESYPLSRDGTILSPRDEVDLPVILFAEDGLRLSVGTSFPAGILQAGVEYQKALPWVEGLSYGPDFGLRLETPEGDTVLLGGPERTAEKIALLQALRAEMGLHPPPPLVIDLRYRRPFLSFDLGDGQ